MQSMPERLQTLRWNTVIVPNSRDPQHSFAHLSHAEPPACGITIPKPETHWWVVGPFGLES
jgi:hypothetical protein